jgi:hypothetical protein
MRCAPPAYKSPQEEPPCGSYKFSDNLQKRHTSYKPLPFCLVGLVDLVDQFCPAFCNCQNM